MKALPELEPKNCVNGLDGFRELLNHAMNMKDTPQKLVKLIDLYENETLKSILQKKNPQINDILKDIDDLIFDLVQYIRK